MGQAGAALRDVQELPRLRQPCMGMASMPTGAMSRARRKQLEKLRAEAEPILFRAAEVGARAAAQERADKFVAAARDAIASWPDKKPWIEDKERKAVSKQVGACSAGPCAVGGATCSLSWCS